jgi:hypothetical protein
MHPQDTTPGHPCPHCQQPVTGWRQVYCSRACWRAALATRTRRDTQRPLHCATCRIVLSREQPTTGTLSRAFCSAGCEQRFRLPRWEGEEWRLIPGMDGAYAVSSFGRVRREVTTAHARAGYILSPAPDRDGYMRCQVIVNGRRDRLRIHQAVAAAFIGPCPTGQMVNHKDTNRANNRAENLEYTTAAGNTAHAKALGRMAHGDRHGARLHPETHARGERHGCAKLTAAQVADIRAQFRPGVDTYTAVGQRYGVNRSTIRRIVEGVHWRQPR